MAIPGDPVRRLAWRLVAPIVLLCLSAGSVTAAVALSFAVPRIAGDGWQVDEARIEIASPGVGDMALSASVALVQLPDGQGELRSVSLACPAVSVTADGWQCDDGQLAAADSPVGKQETRWSGSWRADGSMRLEVPTLRVAGGTLALILTGDGDTWRLESRAYRVRLRSVAALAELPSLPADWNSSGRLSGRLVLDGAGTAARRGSGDLVVDGLGYASPDGTQAAENLVLKIDTRARAERDGWRFDATLRWPNGALYTEPLFHDAASGALTVNLSGHVAPSRQRLTLDAWTLVLERAFTISGSGVFDTRALSVQDLTVAAHSDNAGRVYDLLVQPFLIGTPGDDMAVQGQVGFVLHFDPRGVEQAGLELSDLAMSDRQGRFALRPTTGSVAWQRDGAPSESRLSTRGLGLLGIQSGPFDVRTRFAGERADLVEPVVVPLLGGQVALDSFALTGAGIDGAKPAWTASASVRDVSLDRLTRELEWPPFSGKLAGELREMRYAGGVFTIGGGLRLAAFGGEINVNDLRIEEPLGAVPILRAHAKLRGLDLEAVTRTFAFGRIEGRLDGDIDGLQLVAWEPARFDLHLYTPPDDDSRHRISQRAVENLTELGSGLPAGLSASFLRIFEEFSYDKVDVKIALRGNTASIDGLARDDGGYYLVRGSGLPRIDVIGRNRSVAWTDLLERLREIRVEGVEIQ